MPPLIDMKDKNIRLLFATTVIVIVCVVGLLFIVAVPRSAPILPGNNETAAPTAPLQSTTPTDTMPAHDISHNGIPAVTVTTPSPAPNGTFNKATTGGNFGGSSAYSSAVPDSSGDSNSAPVPTSPSAPVPYTISVSPSSASAAPGETIYYTLQVLGGQGQTEPIHLTLTARALFYTQSYDLGSVEPPFPRTVTYPFTIPSNIPSGITVSGVLSATGGGQTQDQQIVLTIK